MRTKFVGMLTIAWVVSIAVAPGWLRADESQESVDYLRDVKPILQERCFACHGVLQQQAD
jgi:hypothetical protein